MKKLLLLFMLLFASISCTKEDITVVHIDYIEINLNSFINLKSDVEPVFNKDKDDDDDNDGCDFPEKFSHTLPDTFNVYFIPVGKGQTYEFNQVREGDNTFKVEKREYDIVVTNSNVQYREELPLYSNILYLFGETTIDFTQVNTGTVSITNDYSSVMVVKNTSITSIPTLDSREMYDTNVYYNMYTRKKGTSNLQVNNGDKEVTEDFQANHVYRYILCEEESFNMNVEEDTFEETHDNKL